jgi:hypothetical protein
MGRILTFWIRAFPSLVRAVGAAWVVGGLVFAIHAVFGRSLSSGIVAVFVIIVGSLAFNFRLKS